MTDLRSLQTDDFPWARKAQHYIARNQKARALRLLDRVIEYDMPLFGDDPALQEDRRLAWLYRIDLLREWGRLSEALAWTCLECELNPRNVAALALKESLKEYLNLHGRDQGSGIKRRQRSIKAGIWRGVAGMREIKALLERDVILPLKDPELYKRFKVNLPRGVLFYGPPGCGKTFIARKLSEILDFNFMEAKPSDLASIYVHGGQKRIRSFFEAAKEQAPSLIFLDELDALVPNRAGQDLGHHYKSEVNEFLVQLSDCWKNRILVIAATNLIESIDPAILRPGRFDRKIFISPPDLEARLEMLRLYMAERPQEKIAWLELAEKCEFYTSAEIENVVNEAARLALQEVRPIRPDDLCRAMNENPPALSSDKVEKMRSRIGFV